MVSNQIEQRAIEVAPEPAVSLARGNGRTLAEELRWQLADEIVRGALMPGTALDETELARRFRVSRTPVREALRQLAASGLMKKPLAGVVMKKTCSRALNPSKSLANARSSRSGPQRSTPVRRASARAFSTPCGRPPSPRARAATWPAS